MINAESVKEEIVSMAAEASVIREAAKRFLVPVEGSEEAKDGLRMSSAYGAVEVACSIVNIFSALKNPSVNATYMLLSDLTVTLNTNPFWVRNVGSLMPMLIVAVNGANDARELSVANELRWRPLQQQGEKVWLEMLPQLVFLVHGYATYRASSVAIKQTFDGLIYG